MKINKKRLIIFMPSMIGGGVEKNLILITNYLSRHIKNISLITYGKKFNKKFDKKIKIINPKNSSSEKVSKYLQYFECLKILAKEISNNKKTLVFAFQANIYCLIFSKIYNFKTIIRSNASPSGWSKNFIKKYIFKLIFKFADSIIVNSYEFRNELKKKFNINSIVIYNPLNLKEILKRAQKKIDQNLFNSKNRLKIINVGRFTDQKDHITLLKAYKKISAVIEAELLIIGYGKNESLIKNYISQNKLKNVKIKKFDDNPYKYIKRSDLLILTSTYEGLPNVLLEALALKKIVISSNCPTGPKEILKNGKYGLLFKTSNYNELSKKIIDVYKNRKKFSKMSISGFKSLDRFDYNLNCKKYLKIVNKSLKI